MRGSARQFQRTRQPMKLPSEYKEKPCINSVLEGKGRVKNGYRTEVGQLPKRLFLWWNPPQALEMLVLDN
jgi:hypothetical protein